ncbi:hypothetical protein P175DRAFT_0535524 [Aspergillus ochraceoroseus IBT 24754]|uniref:Uncharacterized protein n=2 Tax=Aspergillus subgen. Nidulantes TaxID=2720870 RepID=A0A0F8XT39_9EURO|nr:uncharacterized protein P175DRAFT_0535524 [Aspergillus ochraceoroseus IBT 24754]KKK26682.1 hypothetical protein ARAM_001463 [Aspergillus rambellii]PTU17778.1 hypothetical protein P175DRAFT_0535524 [Aspergillus ochraceoroseus IBT 24754]
MAPIQLPPDAIDDLIYDARTGDLAALQSDLSALSVQNGCPQAVVVACAIDAEPEAEGGSGSCLLHFPAANGNLEILSHLLQILGSSPDLSKEQIQAVINHKNHSGNTALHWAALNTHLECVKALVEAGADVSIQNQAGLDAIFLAERADWGTEEVSKEEEQEGVEEASAETSAEGKDSGPMSKGRQVVEWLLASDKAGELESGIGGDEGTTTADEK